MMKPDNRLRASADIMRVLKSGRKARFFGFSLYVAPVLESGAGLRIACIVGKKVHASSVVRHAIQRRVRAAAARSIHALPTGYDVVIVVHDGVLLTVDFEEMIQSLYYGILTLVE